MKDFQFLNDAGETIVVSRNVLIHVEKEVMDRVRPAKFREILKVDSSIPDWVEQYGYDKITNAANWVPAQEFTEDFVTASTKLETLSFPLFEMVSGYRYRDREMIRAQKMGMNLDASRAANVLLKGEKVLENLAADGTINGDIAAPKYLGSLKGLYNTAGTTILTSGEFAGNTTSWKAALAAGLASSADDYDAACESVISDVLAIEDKSESVTKETTPIDTVVLPLSQKTILRKSKSRGDKTLEQLILEKAKHIQRIIYWYKADDNAYGADGTHKRRCVGLRASDEDAARFVLPKAPVPGRPYQLVNGVHVPVGMVVGGFNTKMPDALVYADLADD